MDPILNLVERSNQRGGRMLSVIDLLEVGTFERQQLCWLLQRVEAGASWLVGARPGGAGKTTIMSALLAMLPAGERVRLLQSGRDWSGIQPGNCLVAYELSPGFYDGYIWGRDLVRMASFGRQGCRLVSNLHADTLAQAHAQIVAQNGATADDLAAFGTFLALSVRGWTRSGGAFLSPRRRVEGIQFVQGGDWHEWRPAQHPPTAREEAIGAFLDECRSKGRRLVGDVRQAWLAWRASPASQG